MIIDCHTHVLPPGIKTDRSDYAAKDAGFALIYDNKKAKIATADDLIDSMDRDGVDISVIANYGWSTPGLCIETNDYIMESVARYPERLVGFGTVLPFDGKAAIAEIERCARGGIRGIGELRLDAPFPDSTRNEAMKSLFEAVQEYKLILLLHASEPVGHIYPGKGIVTPDMLYPIITSFPDMTIVCAHWGGGLPFYALMPEVKEALKNVYFDTAASPFLYHPRIYKLVSQLIGAEKILFGSDYPLLSQKRLIQEIGSADLPEESKELILSGNARRLFGIEA
jgi:predicted TIM-barrel fold metal-dependent hydrolase